MFFQKFFAPFVIVCISLFFDASCCTESSNENTALCQNHEIQLENPTVASRWLKEGLAYQAKAIGSSLGMRQENSLTCLIHKSYTT